jgi:hypothetical protein
VTTCACSTPLGGGDSSATTSPKEGRPPTIDHLLPPRDSTGAIPPLFAWTEFAGADRYAIGLWNEVDVMVWRRDDVRTSSVEWPADLRVEPGTYYWSVTALRDDRPVAESGLSAFVVLR